MEASSLLRLYTAKAVTFFQQYKLPLLTVIFVPLFRVIYLDYRDWYDLGPSGFPRDVRGWVMQSVLRAIASRDLRSTQCFQNSKLSDLDGQSFLDKELPNRSGLSPMTSKHCSWFPGIPFLFQEN